MRTETVRSEIKGDPDFRRIVRRMQTRGRRMYRPRHDGHRVTTVPQRRPKSHAVDAKRLRPQPLATKPPLAHQRGLCICVAGGRESAGPPVEHLSERLCRRSVRRADLRFKHHINLRTALTGRRSEGGSVLPRPNRMTSAGRNPSPSHCWKPVRTASTSTGWFMKLVRMPSSVVSN